MRMSAFVQGMLFGLLLSLLALSLSCAYQSPAAPSRIGWSLRGYGPRVVEIPQHVRTIDMYFVVQSGLGCEPFVINDANGPKYSENICPGDQRTISLTLDFGNTIKIAAPQATLWTITETGSY